MDNVRLQDDLNLKNEQFDALYTNLALNPVWKQLSAEPDASTSTTSSADHKKPAVVVPARRSSAPPTNALLRASATSAHTASSSSSQPQLPALVGKVQLRSNYFRSMPDELQLCFLEVSWVRLPPHAHSI
jgi:hypothetical protein